MERFAELAIFWRLVHSLHLHNYMILYLWFAQVGVAGPLLVLLVLPLPIRAIIRHHLDRAEPTTIFNNTIASSTWFLIDNRNRERITFLRLCQETKKDEFDEFPLYRDCYIPFDRKMRVKSYYMLMHVLWSKIVRVKKKMNQTWFSLFPHFLLKKRHNMHDLHQLFGHSSKLQLLQWLATERNNSWAPPEFWTG